MIFEAAPKLKVWGRRKVTQYIYDTHRRNRLSGKTAEDMIFFHETWDKGCHDEIDKEIDDGYAYGHGDEVNEIR